MKNHHEPQVQASLPPNLTMDHLPILYQLFEQALAPTPSIRAPAEAQLHQCETLPGYLECCWTLVTSASEVPQNTRLLISICIKNLLARHWKKHNSATPLLASEEAKSEFRHALLGFHEHTSASVAKQLHECCARLARVDWPQDWSGCFPTLLSHLGDHPAFVLQRLQRLTKELAKRKMMMHRKAFQHLATSIFPMVFQYWQNLVSREISELGPKEWTLVIPCTKVLSLLSSHGLLGILEIQDKREFSSLWWQRIHTLLQAGDDLTQGDTEEEEERPKSKFLRILARTIVDTQKNFPIAFGPYLGPFLDLAYTQLMVQQQSRHTGVSHRVRLHWMMVLSNILYCSIYDQNSQVNARLESKSGDTRASLETLAPIQHVLASFFTSSRRETLCLTLLHLHMPLSSFDLERWTDDPEVFFWSQEQLTASENLRAGAENLFLFVLQKSRQAIAPVFLHQFLHETPLPTQVLNSIETMCALDAMYLGVGLAYYELHDAFDFSPWFHQVVLPALEELSRGTDDRLSLRLIKRRLVWLTGCWLAQIPTSGRPALYAALLRILHSRHFAQDDLVVKLESVVCLHGLIDDWAFDMTDFRPFLASSIDACIHVLSLVCESESTLKLMTVMTSLVRHMTKEDIETHSLSNVLDTLPQIWTRVETHHASSLVRVQLLHLYVELIRVLTFASLGMHETLVPVIAFATDFASNSDSAVYLAEPALLVWKELLEHTSAYSPLLSNLLPNLFELLSRDLEFITIGLEIVEQYWLLGQDRLWQEHGLAILSLLHSLCGQVKPEGMIHTAEVMELFVRGLGRSGLTTSWTCGWTALSQVLLQACLDQAEPERVLVQYVNVLCRLVLDVPELVFRDILAQSAQLEGLVQWMLRYFFQLRASSEQSPVQAKLWASTLLRFVLLPHLVPDAFGQILDVCAEVSSTEELKQEEFSQVRQTDSKIPALSAARERKRQFMQHDPVPSVNLAQLCQSVVKEQCPAHMEGQKLQQLLQLTDSNVLKKLHLV